MVTDEMIRRWMIIGFEEEYSLAGCVTGMPSDEPGEIFDRWLAERDRSKETRS